MNRSELVRRLVLSEIADDFENVDQSILPGVAEGAVEFGLTIERSEIVEALASLVADGMALAYQLSPPLPSRRRWKVCHPSTPKRRAPKRTFIAPGRVENS